MFGKNRNAKQASVSHNSKSASPAYADENHKVTPPTHAASSYMRSLREGNPNEKVEVPMIHSTHELSLGDYLPFGSAMKTGKRTVISRSMTRDCYIKHYAKDDEGNYIGTEKPYPDWQLVFVPNKGTPEDILRQGALCCVSFLFAFFLVPETKGLTLEQVDKMLEETTPRTSQLEASQRLRF
ncbi:hypothetical protein ST47_g6155 [Ascochyta rabiei]|uniref:Uncharacterized protein n=1 Tax=Didymella rabiei TaxID=5454 RepID=A0A163CPS5_DIDRA|nr:hypothetical protein ST47_g6155 [Ascochyta rabiei]